MFPSVTIWVLRNGLSSPPPHLHSAMQYEKKKRSHAVINELVKSPFSLLQPTLLLPSSQEQELPVPPVCRSSAWGFRVTPTPAFPQRGAPALEGFSVALLALGFVLFLIFFSIVCSVWFSFTLCDLPLFFSSVHAARVFSQRYVELLSSSWQQSPSSHPTFSPPAASICVRNHLLSVFLPSGTSCLNLEALLPFFVPRRRDIPWRPALCTHLPLGPFLEVPSLGLPLTWRNPISTVTGNAQPWVPLSSQSHWWSSWRIS